MSPKVSVIIASYNHERFIREAVESVLQQTFQDFEILIADDGSTDGSPEIIQSFSDPRIKSFCFPKNREQHPRNFCLERAHGEFIALLNSDDVFHPKKLQCQLDVFATNSTAGAVFSWIRLIDERGGDYPDQNHSAQQWFREPNRSRSEWLRRFFEEGNHLCHPTALIRKNLIDRVGRYNPLLAFASDYDLWVKLALQADIYVVPEALLEMRILDGEANASGHRPTIIRRSIFEIGKLLRNFASVNAIEQLPEIFPEHAEALVKKSKNARRHWIAEKALHMHQESHRLFGLDLLYELLSDATIREELVSECGPGILGNFMRHTAHSNPLGSNSFISAQLFWPVEGAYREAHSRDAIVSPGKPQQLIFADVPAKPGDRLRFDPADQCGVIHLHKFVVREQTSGNVVLELSFPKDEECLALNCETIPLAPETTAGSLFACLSADPQFVLPAISKPFSGHLRVEISFEFASDWQAIAPVLQKEPLSDMETVSIARKLRASLVSKFSR